MVDEVSPEELRELRLDYLKDVREKIALIEKQIAALRRDSGFKTAFPLLLFLSHQLKGSGGSLGFPRVSNLAQKMNEALNQFLEEGKPRPSPDALARSISSIAVELGSVVDEEESNLRAAS